MGPRKEADLDRQERVREGGRGQDKIRSRFGVVAVLYVCGHVIQRSRFLNMQPYARRGGRGGFLQFLRGRAEI